MKPHPDSTIIFNKIKKDSGLNESDEYVMQSSFKDIENMVLTKQNASVSPSEGKETK